MINDNNKYYDIENNSSNLLNFFWLNKSSEYGKFNLNYT